MKVRTSTLDSHIPLLDGVVLLAGVWLLICPFVLGFGQVARSNDIILGGIVTILAAIRFFGGQRVVMLSWMICLLGIWTMGCWRSCTFACRREALCWAGSS